MAGKIVIAVVHKLDTVLDFDKIAVLEAGSLVEFDTPDVLVSKDAGVVRGWVMGESKVRWLDFLKGRFSFCLFEILRSA